MTDNQVVFSKQQPNQDGRLDLRPQLPTHDQVQGSDSPSHTPAPSGKPLQRAKTMKPKFEKFRGLFKNKEHENPVPKEPRSQAVNIQVRERQLAQPALSNDDPIERPVSQATSHYSESFRDETTMDRQAPSAASHDFPRAVTPTIIQMQYSPPDDQERVQQLLESTAQQTLSAEAEEARQQLQQIMEAIREQEADIQKQYEQKMNLQREVDNLNREIRIQEEEYAQIEHKFFAHSRAIRATDDDLSTIRDAFKHLKYSIARIIMTLNKKGDSKAAIAKYTKIWPTLQIVDAQGQLEPTHINLLAEKLIHEHLVTRVFESPMLPGLEINDAYQSLNKWLCDHGSPFAVRLRQQLASIVAKNKNETLIEHIQQEKTQITYAIYNDLADIYHPFLHENDAAVDQDKTYLSKIKDIVEKAIKLALAIRGQEVDIATLSTKEGESEFDEETMVDVKGRTAGIVRFCICPPFKGGDGEHGFIEKGKVVIC